MSSPDFLSFQPTLTQFLDDLAQNNNRDWFNQQKRRYESDVLQPVMHFIRAMKPRLMEISPYLMVEAKKVGGSMFRIHRDTRFSKDKTPFKTHIGIRFPHREFKQSTGPGLYMHISSQNVYLAIGVWHPETGSLNKIRAKIDKDPHGWLEARDDSRFRELYELAGAQLKSAPHGYPKDHPLIEDLRRKDFVGVQELPVATLFKKGLPDRIAKSYAVASPFLRFLAEALAVPF